MKGRRQSCNKVAVRVLCHSTHPEDIPFDISKPLGQAIELRVNGGFRHDFLHDALLQLLHLRLQGVQ